MKILMVSSEAAPFAKAGGLGDAVSALSRALSRAGHDVRLLLPRYYSIDRKRLEKMEGALAFKGETPTGGSPGAGATVSGAPMGSPPTAKKAGRKTAATAHGPAANEDSAFIYKSYLPGSTVETWFLDNERYFGRDGIYGSKTEPDFPDNPERFAFLCRAAFSLCRKLGWIPDIVHAHDWPTSLVPVLLRHEEGGGEFAKTASVLTIHNLGYQGVYAKESFSSFHLPWELFYGAGFEFFDKVNLLKAGIHSADCLTTVSPSYAREIQTPDSGFGLDGLLRHRSADLVGILNGVDLDEWDPETDLHIPARFSASKLAGKAACKAELQKRLGLPVSAEKPLIGMVTRLTDQKGVGELFGPLYGSAYRICSDMDLQIALVGSGEKWCEDEVKVLSGKLANFKAKVGFDEGLAHLVEAGSDFFLMPSRYEPCGLNQMYSLRYGSLPIVHRTGGLSDTVENYNQESGAGTGFMFDILTPRAIYDTVGWAVWAWYNRREHISAMRERAMNRRFSWEHSALEYAKLYERALGLETEGRVAPGRSPLS